MNDDSLDDTCTARAGSTGGNKILPFKPRVTPEVKTGSVADAALVHMFEHCLKAAKEGKIKFGAVAVVSQSGEAITTWEPAVATSQLITSGLGAIAFLNSRFGTAADGGGEFTDELVSD